MAMSFTHGAELEQNQGPLGGLQREAGARSMPSCLRGKYHEPDSSKWVHKPGQATAKSEKPQVWSVFITGHPGKSQLVYWEACFLTLLTDVREGVPWGPGGTGVGRSVRVPLHPQKQLLWQQPHPHPLQRQGKALWDAPDTLQIHRDLPFPFSGFGLLCQVMRAQKWTRPLRALWDPVFQKKPLQKQVAWAMLQETTLRLECQSS